MEKYLTLDEAAVRLGLPYKTVARMVRSGELPARRSKRVYQVAEQAIAAFARKQKATPPPLPAGRQVIAFKNAVCCVCNSPILTDLAVGGSCEVTRQPICQACWFIRKARRAGVAAMGGKADAVPPAVKAKAEPPALPVKKAGKAPPPIPEPPPLPVKAGRKGATVAPPVELPAVLDAPVEANGEVAGVEVPPAPLVELTPVVNTPPPLDTKLGLTADKARVAEDTFLRCFGERMMQVETLLDPLRDAVIELRKAKVKHSITGAADVPPNLPANRSTKFTIKAGGWGKPKAAAIVEGQFLSRLDVLATRGYDNEPLDETILQRFINDLTAREAQADCFHLVVIASPTGWTDAAGSIVLKQDKRSAMNQKHLAIALEDLKDGKVIGDESDERLAMFWQVLDPQRFTQNVKSCADTVRNLLLGKASISIKEAAAATKMPAAWLRAAFEVVKADDRYATKVFPDIGLVIYRATA